MAKIFLFIYNWSSRHKLFFYLIVLAGTILFAWLASRLQFEEDFSKMLPANVEIQELNEAIQNSSFKDKLVINIYQTDSSAKADPDKLVAYASALSDSLHNNFLPNQIQEIAKISESEFTEIYDLFYENLPLFLDSNDYDSIETMLTDEGVESALKSRYKSLVSTAGFALKDFILKDPFNLTTLALKKLQALQLENNYETRDGFIITKDHRNLLLFIVLTHPVNETSENGKLLEGIDRLFMELSEKYDRKVRAEYFGGAAMAVANAQRLKKDIFITVSLALVVLITLISFFFRKKAVFLMILLPTIFGGLFSLGCLYLLVHKVSVVSLGVGSVLLGITIDYPLHILTHFRKERSVAKVLNDITLPILTSCLTTATAFLCLVFLEAKAMNNLGLFVAISIIGSALFSLIVLPTFLDENSKAVSVDAGRLKIIDRIAAYNYHRNRPLLFAIAVFSLACLFTFKNIGFESDLTSMNYVPDRLSQAEKHLNEINQYSLKSIFLFSKGDNLNEALSNNEKLLNRVDWLHHKGSIKKYTEISSLLPSDSKQNERIFEWNYFWTKERKQRVKDKLINIGRQYKFKETAFDKFYDLIEKDFQPVSLSKFDKIRMLFLENFISESDDKTTVMTLLRVDEDKKKVVYTAFEGYNNLIIFDNKQLTSKLMEILKDDFNLLVKLSIILVFLILIYSYGRIELGLITFVPMAASWLWTLGIMGAFGIKFNMFNLMISSFIFGLGIDYSIFVSRGYLQEYKYGIRNITTYKTSILLSSITTLVGIGVLIFARHPALRSIALMSIIGILSVIIITFTVQPLLIKAFILNRKKKKSFPVTLGVFAKTMVTWGLLLLGCIILIMVGVVIFTIVPLNSKRRKALFHRMFMYSTRIYISVTFPFSCKIQNQVNEDFKKPAVIICNHQSLIDTPLMLMLAPKFIMLTNDWVRNSPHFGPISRFADFYSVSSGIDKIMDKLQEIVDDGYSIVVFPEGTRSGDMNIHRFHKGAFYIAEKLNLDILPILFHGTGDFLGKNDFWGDSNKIAIKIMGRISPDEQQYGKTYSEMAKGIRKLMISEYDKFRKENVTPEYLRRRLIANYLYKGPVLEWYVKVKMWLENNYKLVNEKLPNRGEIMDIGCGYGYMTYMLGYLSRERKIIGVDYDNEKIEVAENCYAKNENIQFKNADILELDIPRKDAFILSDVLHYLKKEEQMKLLSRCFEKLNKNGTIIIRDADASLRKRQIGTRLTEIFSTKTGFNKTIDSLEFLSSHEIIKFAEDRGLQTELIDDAKITSNVFIVINN